MEVLKIDSKRSTRSTAKVEEEKPVRKIVRAKRTQKNIAATFNVSSLNLSSAKKNINQTLPSEFKKKRSPFKELLVKIKSDAYEVQFPEGSVGNINKRKLRSAKVNISQDDDNPSFGTSSEEEHKKHVKLDIMEKKTLRKHQRSTKLQESMNEAEAKTSDSDANVERQERKKLRNKKKSTVDVSTRKPEKKKQKHNSKKSKKAKSSPTLVEKTANKVIEEVYNGSDKENTSIIAAAKISSRRSTYDLEEPSILLLNSTMGSILNDDINISGVGKIDVNKDSLNTVVPDSTTNIKDAKTKIKRLSSLDSSHMKNKTIKDDAQEPDSSEDSFGFASKKRHNCFKISEEKSPLSGKELRRSTYEINKQVGNLSNLSPILPKVNTKSPSLLKQKGLKSPILNLTRSANKFKQVPSGSSTPVTDKKNVSSLLKHTLNKSTKAKLNSLLSTQEKTTTKNKTPSTRTKMPNFALIHKQAEEKMENLAEFRSRQKERAKNLLSGIKPAATSTTKNLRRSLSAGAERRKSDQKTKKQLVYSSSVDLHNIRDGPSSLGTVSTAAVAKKTSAKKENSRLNTPTKLVSKTPKVGNNSSLVRPAFKTPKVMDVKTKPKNVTKSSKPRPSEVNNVGINRFGFKKITQEEKKDLRQAVANKTKSTNHKNDIKDKREIMKGVRTNRRFELLMQMRRGM